jgi:hypothetical protein
MSRRLVIVSGAGRSGTSLVAGCLAHLGYVVPPPELAATAANPRGHFEPKWAVEFHKRLLSRASVDTLDTRPWALDLVEKAAVDGPFQRQLTEWLDAELERNPQLVVKDPRAFWARDLWLRAAKAADAQSMTLTMLRHPVEVMGSRDAYYETGRFEDERAARMVRNLAGWINSSLVNELTSREEPRAFLRYGDLLADWRSTMAKVDDALDLGISPAELSAASRWIDDFVDPSLHRVHLTWDDVRVPRDMREIAEQAWTALAGERDSLVLGPGRIEELDTLRVAYRQTFTDAVALATDQVNTLVEQARREARRQAKTQQNKRGTAADAATVKATPEQRAAAADVRAKRREAGVARALGGEQLPALIRRMGGQARAEWRNWRVNR